MALPIRINVKARVPARPAGRLVDTLTDILRPFAEKRALKADQIRLQREEVLIEIVKKARLRVELSKQPIRAVPNKALVPLLEKASLENPKDKTMIELWANLLASAALGHNTNVPRYASILSEINGRQARLLEQIVLIHSPKRVRLNGERLLDDLWRSDQGNLLYALDQTHPIDDPDEIIAVIVDELRMNGIMLDTIMVGKGSEQWDWTGLGAGKPFIHVDKHILDVNILQSLNLLRDMSFKFTKLGEFDLSVLYYQVTPLAIDLFAACNPHLMDRH